MNIPDDLLVAIQDVAEREGRTAEDWVVWHLRLHLFGHRITLPPTPERGSARARHRRVPLTARTRAAAFIKSGGKCYHCGAVLPHDGQWEVDHLHPVALGGQNEAENLVLSCRPCNLRKGGRAA